MLVFPIPYILKWDKHNMLVFAPFAWSNFLDSPRIFSQSLAQDFSHIFSNFFQIFPFFEIIFSIMNDDPLEDNKSQPNEIKYLLAIPMDTKIE